MNNYINPVAFELLGKPVYWYGIIISATILLGYYLAELEARKRGIKKDKILDLLIIALPIAFIFARAYYVIFRWDYYSKNYSEIVAIWDGGIAIYGGLIGGLLVLLIFSNRNKIKILKLLDIIAPSLLLGQALGRWGNFFNHEAYGEIVTKSFLQKLNIPKFIIENMYIDGSYRQPTFLYESVWCFIVLIILLIIKNKLYSGEVFSFYMIFYGVERFIVEGMRTDSLYIGIIRVSQIVSLIMVILGICYFIFNRFNNKKKILYINS